MSKTQQRKNGHKRKALQIGVDTCGRGTSLGKDTHHASAGDRGQGFMPISSVRRCGILAPTVHVQQHGVGRGVDACTPVVEGSGEVAMFK